MCYGKLHLATEEIENLCLCDVEMLVQGWKQRYKDRQILLAAYCTLPLVNIFSKKEIKLEDIIKDETTKDDFADMTDAQLRELAEE